jgi:phage gp46-like protein
MDLKVIETGNGGDIVKTPRDLTVISGLENMVYLGMFGGNPEQSTPSKRDVSEQAFDWWGNSLLMPNDPGRQFNSITERVLNETALTSSGRKTIEEAVLKDLEFMKPFAQVSVSASIPATDKVVIEITVKEPSNLQEKKYVYIWDATKNELTV